MIFFARYEASQYGSPYIETEHLLLGLMREDKALANRFLRTHGSIESIRKEIESRITVRERISTSVEVPLSQECKRILNFAAEEAERLGHKHVGTEHLLLGVLREEKSFGAEILLERGLRLSTVREELARSAGEKVPVNRPKEASLLAEFSRDLTQAAMEGQLDPLVGRDSELERAIQILCRRTKNNPVLIGEPGVGKTAIVEGLAQRIADGDVPPFLADKRILSLDLSLIVAGTKYRGQFEERLKTIMKELMESQNAIVFIDELHTLVGAGSAEGSLDAANILKPALSRGEIQCIGATTPGEYRKSVEKDRSLERRFQAVKVAAPERRRSHSRAAGRARPLRKIPRRQLHGRSHPLRRVSLEPLHSGPLPAGQGHRSDRRSRRAREAAPGHASRRSVRSAEAREVHHPPDGNGHRQSRIREGAFLFRRRAQGKRTPAHAAREAEDRRFLHRHRRRAKTSKKWSRAGPAWRSPRSRKTSSRSCCASKKSCTGASSARTRPSPRWRAPFAAAARA